MQQERREQVEPEPPKFPRYDPSIRVVTLFFAAVLGFGLKHLLDIPNAQNTVEIIYTCKWFTLGLSYKWLFSWWLPSFS